MAHTVLIDNNKTDFRFPQEITDIIIDFLHHDVQSLLACALVSHSWLPSSRFHLFRSCTIRDPRRLEVAFRTVATTSDVGTYVRQLTIVGEGIHSFALRTFKALLLGLPHLRRLKLHQVTLRNGRPGYRATGRHNAPGLPQDKRQKEKGPFALEELQLLECDITTANYTHLFRLLGLFSSIHTLFLASSSTARRQYSNRRLPDCVIKPGPVAVQHLHTFDIPFPIIEALLTTLSAANALRTFWYDDNVLDWTVGLRSSEVDKFGKMMTSLPSHQHLHCLILGPLPIFGNLDEMGRSLARLQLASVRGLHTFHLRGRWLEPHVAGVFAALPDTVREARFVVVGISYFRRLTHGGEGPRYKFREFAQAFLPVLRGRSRMTFVLDLGVAKTKLSEEQFGMIKDRAEEGLLLLKQQGHLLIDDSPKE